jgi:hypothetical protein
MSPLAATPLAHAHGRRTAWLDFRPRLFCLKHLSVRRVFRRRSTYYVLCPLPDPRRVHLYHSAIAPRNVVTASMAQ